MDPLLKSANLRMMLYRYGHIYPADPGLILMLFEGPG